MNRRRVLGSLLLAAGMVLGALRWRTRTPSSPLLQPEKRKPLGELQVPLIDGQQWSLAAQRGHPVLINYWATWCAPCQEEMPALDRLARQGADGVAVLGVSLDAGPGAAERVRNFAVRFRIGYPLALKEPEPVTTASDVIGIPNTLLIDSRGRLAKVYAGPVESAEVTNDLRRLEEER